MDPRRIIDRLVDATNTHDLDGLVACFTADYVNETPAHPVRGFQGRDQVRRNWAAIFTGVPDISARVTATAVQDDRVWNGK
jgi:ketosteroid isomerase-like protein